jgi:uncharacterized OsmC-like protein
MSLDQGKITMGRIRTLYKGDMLFESRLGNHSVVLDVPANMGGKDRAPTPLEMFSASLGACVAAFVAQYCNRAGIDTTDMSVDVTFDKAGEPLRLTNLQIEVKLPNGEYGNRKDAILRVAQHCPVHETITTLEQIEIVLLGKQELQPVAAVAPV